MLWSGSFVSRLTAVSLLVLLLLVGYQSIIRPLVERYQDNRATITRSRALLQRYLQLSDEREAFAEHLAAIEKDRKRLSQYFDESSEALAAAAIQDRVADTIASAGGEVQSLQTLPADAVEGQPMVRRIGLELRFAASIDGLAATLYQLESMKPSLFVDKLVVTARGGGLRSAGKGQESDLDIRIEVFGYAQSQVEQSADRERAENRNRKQSLRTGVSPSPRAQVRLETRNVTVSDHH